MSHTYKVAKICECGFTTTNRGHWSTHKNHRCEYRAIKKDDEKEQLKEQVKVLKNDKEHLREQLQAKDRQIEELIKLSKKPRTVNHTTNNRYVVEQNVNVFGKETMAHITPEQIQGLLADPENAVARLVKLKHRKEPVNSNVRCPNLNRAIYQVVVGEEGGEKEWENRAKGEVLEQLYDDNSCLLESEATEDNTPFMDHQDKIKDSIGGSDGGRQYKQQLDKIHNVLVS